MSAYFAEPATAETLNLATSIVNAWEKFIDPAFEELSAEELAMFVVGRAHLNAESQILYDQESKQAVAFIGLMSDKNREKFWTQVAIAPNTDLMGLAVTKAIELALNVEPSWKLQPNVNDQDAAQIAAWNSYGFEKIQTSYAMNINSLPSSFPNLPANVGMRTLQSESDWISVKAIQGDAFDGHFGFVPIPLEDFKAFRLDSDSFDPLGIHILSIDGIDIGYVEVTNEISHLNKGFINNIGVIHSHHKKGFGKLLLEWAFAYCASKGFEGAMLYVDIANKSGALKFYENAGMAPVSAYGTYEKLDWNKTKMSLKGIALNCFDRYPI